MNYKSGHAKLTTENSDHGRQTTVLHTFDTKYFEFAKSDNIMVECTNTNNVKLHDSCAEYLASLLCLLKYKILPNMPMIFSLFFGWSCHHDMNEFIDVSKST